MRETAQVLILPTDDGSSLFNSAQDRRKNSPSIRHQSVASHQIAARMDKSTMSLLLCFLDALIGIAGVAIRVALNTSRTLHYISRPEQF
jgi:hypothetical protein